MCSEFSLFRRRKIYNKHKKHKTNCKTLYFVIDRQAENTDMTTKIIQHTIFCVTFSCFVGTEFLKIQQSGENRKKQQNLPKLKWFDLIIFSRKLKQSWVSEDIMILPWLPLEYPTKSISFDQKGTTFDRFWWSKKTTKNVHFLYFLVKSLSKVDVIFGGCEDFQR